MSFNPVAAANFGKRRKQRKQALPRQGTKHSDIMRRNGLGTTLPMDARLYSRSGMAALLFSGKDFVVRGELLAAGNATSYGFNPKGDRMYLVRDGALFVTFEDAEGNKQIKQFQSGSSFSAPAGTKHCVGSSGTADVEILVIESAKYGDKWQELEAGVGSGLPQNAVLAVGPQPIPARTGDIDKAKRAAVAERVSRNRRQPKSAELTAAQRGQAGPRTVTGSQNIGRNTASNPNSGNVTGVNPMPSGPGGFRD